MNLPLAHPGTVRLNKVIILQPFICAVHQATFVLTIIVLTSLGNHACVSISPCAADEGHTDQLRLINPATGLSQNFIIMVSC